MDEIKYPLSNQDFEKIIKDKKVYVDKTALIYRLINKYDCVFLSRPRRFGKSLLLTTIKAFFEGKKELFEGLSIYDLEKDWKKHPVIHMELSNTNPLDPISLEVELNRQFVIFEKLYGIEKTDATLSARFSSIIHN